MNSEPLEITAGGAGPYDPAVGASSCRIPVLAGRLIRIEKRGLGTLKTSEWSALQGGGFSLPAGVTFGANEVYFVYDLSLEYGFAASRYSNGFDSARVLSVLFGRIGWRSTTPASPVLTITNATAKSGRYFSDFHALCTPFIVKQIIDDAKATDDSVNTELELLQRGAIMTALNQVLNEPEILETGLDFDNYGEIWDVPIENTGSFVGRRIYTSPDPSVTVQIDRVGLYFEQDVTFTLYLFQEGNPSPVWSQQVTALAKQKTLVDLSELYLNYLGAGNLGGCFYLGYFQDDLLNGAGAPVRALNETRLDYMNQANTWRIEPVQAARVPGQTNFNRVIVPPSSPWTNGLHLSLSSFRDWSQVIVRKANVFDNLIGLVMAAAILEKCLVTVRSNKEERIIKDQLASLGIYQDLTGVQPGVEGGPKTTGLRRKIDQEAERVKKSFYPSPRAYSYSSEGGCS